jgi:hypothetical protein
MVSLSSCRRPSRICGSAPAYGFSPPGDCAGGVRNAVIVERRPTIRTRREPSHCPAVRDGVCSIPLHGKRYRLSATHSRSEPGNSHRYPGGVPKFVTDLWSYAQPNARAISHVRRTPCIQVTPRAQHRSRRPVATGRAASPGTRTLRALVDNRVVEGPPTEPGVRWPTPADLSHSGRFRSDIVDFVFCTCLRIDHVEWNTVVSRANAGCSNGHFSEGGIELSLGFTRSPRGFGSRGREAVYLGHAGADGIPMTCEPACQNRSWTSCRDFCR